MNLLKDSPIQSGINASIVSAIILGHRDEYWQEIALPFRDTGTAHLLAISGLHLAIVCGMVLLAARLFGFPPRRVVFIAIISTTLMLILADVRTPLARAGIMFLIATTLLGFRWRVSASTLLAVGSHHYAVDKSTSCLGSIISAEFRGCSGAHLGGSNVESSKSNKRYETIKA